MFTWICPKCGREVRTSESECPNCAKPAQSATEAAATDAPVASTATPPPPPLAYAAPEPRGGLPTWLMAIVFTFAFIGLVGGVYWAIQHFRGGGAQAAAAPMVPMDNPAGKANAAKHPLQKYIEISGIRFEGGKKTTEARFVVTNHSEGEITGLEGSVNIWGRTAKSEEEPVGSFKFKLPTLGPNESKEVREPLNTKLKVYELPDWQNVNTEVLITAP